MEITKYNEVMIEFIGVYLNSTIIYPGNGPLVSFNLLSALEKYKETHSLAQFVTDLDIIDTIKSMPYNTKEVQRHTLLCHMNYSFFQDRIVEWKKKYPNHCYDCKGTGGEWDFNYPISPDDFSTCLCIDPQDEFTPRCPRCGTYWEVVVIDNYSYCKITEEGLECPHCNWTEKVYDASIEEWPGCTCSAGEI